MRRPGNMKRDANLARNVRITIATLQGQSYSALGKEHGDLSRQRIQQIIQRICEWAKPRLYTALQEADPRGRVDITHLREHKEEFIQAIEAKAPEPTCKPTGAQPHNALGSTV